MRRKTNFKQMFLIDSTLYKRVNSEPLLTSTPKPVPRVSTSLPETPTLVEVKETPSSQNSNLQKDDDDDRKSTTPKDEKFFDATNPIVKALKEHHEQSVESPEPLTKKARYEDEDNKIDFKQMIMEIDGEIKNWTRLRKDALKMQSNESRKRKQPRYVHYFAGQDGFVKSGE